MSHLKLFSMGSKLSVVMRPNDDQPGANGVPPEPGLTQDFGRYFASAESGCWGVGMSGLGGSGQGCLVVGWVGGGVGSGARSWHSGPCRLMASVASAMSKKAWHTAQETNRTNRYARAAAAK